MERMALVCPLLPTAVFSASPSLTYLLTQSVSKRRSASDRRMSVFDRLAPSISPVSASPGQTNENSSVCSPPPLSLSSPVIKKKPIQIPSFDYKGLIDEQHNKKQFVVKNTDRSFVPICSSMTSAQPSWGKSCQHEQQNHGERASTLPRAKPKMHCSPTLSAKPSISIVPVPKPESSPTLSTLKPIASPQLPNSQLSDPSLTQHQSPTLTVPTPRLSPSPTSLCTEMSLNDPGAKQPSPVAKERRVRSINISNTAAEPESCKQSLAKEAKHGVLDRETLTDFTHSALRGEHPSTWTESRHQSNSESKRHAAMSQISSLLRGKVGLIKREGGAKCKPKPPPTSIDTSTTPKPSSGGARGTQTSFSDYERTKFANVLQKESWSAFDEPANRQSHNFLKKSTEYPQNRLEGFASDDPIYERVFSKRSATLPMTSTASFPMDPALNQLSVSPNVETRRRQYGFSNETKVDRTSPSGSSLGRPQKHNDITGSSSKLFQQTSASPQTKRFCLKAPGQSSQLDVKAVGSRSDCISMDYSCQSRDIDRNRRTPLYSHTLNPFQTRLVTPRTQEDSRPASVEGDASKTTISKPDILSHKHPLDLRQHLGQNKRHNEANLRDTGVNEKGIFATSDQSGVVRNLPEYPTAKWQTLPNCSLSENHFSLCSKGVSNLPSQPQHRMCQRPDEPSATASPPLHRPNYSPAHRAFIIEEPEDPYYVTMYYQGSEYVDMSDIIPPEVRPKPAIPAKPPSVGAASPLSPFAAQGLGIGGGNSASVLPPSSIPVPVGSHGSMHISSHNVGHGAGHTVAHNGGHGQGGPQSTGGGSTLLGYIGIDTIIEQMRKKTMKTGFEFNVMAVGNSGLGKSTLVNTLFKSQVSRRSAGWGRDEKIPKTVEVKTVSHVLEEGGVKMKLTVIDTPGFGDQINNDNCWEPISKYINEQYEKFLKEEVNITRKKRIPDTRVHCCLYFISPTGHSLRQLDVEFMKHLSHSVNIIPVIAKADTMTIEERQEFKQRVRKELEMGGIEFYPQKEFDEDMEDKSDNDKIRELMPFAVVGSDKEYQVNGKRVLGRKTPWGIVEVENPNHCEFAQLRDFLIRSHLQDLKEVTHNIHYETFRAKRLNENGGLHQLSSSDTQESNL